MPPVTPTSTFAASMPGSITGRSARNDRSETGREMVLYVPRSAGPDARIGRKVEGSGQQGAEPALVGGSEGVAEADRPRGAAQGGGPCRLPRAVRHLRE